MAVQLTATFVSLFPQSVDSLVHSSILGRAIKAGIFDIDHEQIRDHALDKHKTVDDTPYSGGPGQLMRVDVVTRAIRAATERNGEKKRRILLMDPAGKPFTQSDSKRLSEYEHLIFVCGRYEGIDARIHHYVDEAISIGDYILTGGELPALVILDAVARHLPGVLGNECSASSESMSENLLEYSQYTRPVEFEGHQVPDVFIGGNHAQIARERRKEQLLRTKALRPDLYARHSLTKEDEKLLK